MSRRALSITVGILGTLMAFGTLVGMNVMGSVLADARTNRITGPGVDVSLLTPFPAPGTEVVLEVEARGGNRAGIESIVVSDGAAVLAQATGAGATWGSTITESKTRGSESMLLRLGVPRDLTAGARLPLSVKVGYVVALNSGTASFTDENFLDTVHLDVPVLSETGRRWARLLLAGRALLYFLIWFAAVWGVAALYARAEEGGPVPGGDDTEMEAIGLLMGGLGGGFLGYWLFARTLMAACEVQAIAWAIVFTTLWCALPLAWAWRWSQRRGLFVS